MMHYCKTKLKATDKNIIEAFNRDERTVRNHIKKYSAQLCLEKAEKKRRQSSN